jgi:DUF3072 family protein
VVHLRSIRSAPRRLAFKVGGDMPIPHGMDGCIHAMDPAWCYLCRIERSGADPRVAWGLGSAGPDAEAPEQTGPMTLGQASYLRFLCEEFSEPFDASLTGAEAAVVIGSFLDEPLSASQDQTLRRLSAQAGEGSPTGLTYGQARSKIRGLVARRGLGSA